MNPALVLLRHAKSSWRRPLPDADRPLAGRGRRDAPAMGRWFASHYPTPGLVLCSNALRCRQTLDLFVRELARPPAEIIHSGDLYHASAAALLRSLQPHLARGAGVMLVGHNPGLDELLLYLARQPPGQTDNGKLMTTCALAVLQPGSGNRLRQSDCEVKSLMRPRELSNH